ncbi:hypothetical protein Hte_009933 [Hypoxylon texense]
MPRARKRSRPEDDDDDDVSNRGAKSSTKTSKTSKKAKTTAATDSGKDDEGNSFWPLGGTRRATVSSFKGKDFVNIREYYSDASGDLKPGKKGIMLTPEQYAKLLEAIPSICAELREKGHELPDVSSAPAPALAPTEDEDEDKDEDEDEDEDAPKSPVKPKKAKKQPKKGKKANIEATSDEEEESD